MDYVAEVARLARLRQTRSAGWGIVLALFAISLAVRLGFGRALDATPFAPFIPALPVAALLCGWRRALALLGFSIAASWMTVSRSYTLALAPSLSARFAIFLALGLFLIALAELMAQAVQRMETSARVNADMFRELQHRVANNFQIVAATLQKARRKVADEAARAALDQAINRIGALGRLHRQLYDPDSYRAGLEPILREVLRDTFQGVEADLRADIRSENLSVGQMTTIVLLVNEAALNAAKHVFAPRLGGRFHVSLTAEGRRHLLTIADDGPGFGVEDPEERPRYGLTVMRGLAAQLGGELEISGQPGVEIRVAFTA